MATYIVLTRVNAQGLRNIKGNPDRFTEIAGEIRAMDGKILDTWALLGKWDFAYVISAPDNPSILRMMVERAGRGTIQFEILPAMDLALFVRLLGQTTETTGPYPWMISWWAQIGRRLLRNTTYTKPAKEAFTSLTVLGRENLDGFKGPAIYIANHASHLDTIALHNAVPEHVRRRLTYGGAADRWFLKGRKEIRKRGFYQSLAFGTWPIKRGGGTSSLDFGKWLLDKKWNLMIFPEGTRTTTGRMSKFRTGVAIIALEKNVPVVPIYMEGLRELRPKGSQQITPGPVTVKIGKPIHFAPGTDPRDATHQMYEAMEAMRLQLRALRPPRRSMEPPAAAAM
jgi:1-acyl-sn-glycerol-3-phosphate acyltransferase